MSANDFSDYLSLVSGMSRSALSPRGAGARPCGLNLGLPAARLLLQDDLLIHAGLVEASDLLAQAPILELTDAIGHRRPVYGMLVLHLHQLARLHRHESLEESGRLSPLDVNLSRCLVSLANSQPVPTSDPDSTDHVSARPIDLSLWLHWCVLLHLKQLGERFDRRRQLPVLEALIRSTGETGPLSPAPTDADQSPDAWAYRDLVALHALFGLGVWCDKPHWLARAHAAAVYHVENTQPDYFTNQPWALAAFLHHPDTRSFGEQQLHDCSINPGGETGGLSVLAGLLLADAAATLRVATPVA